MKSPLLAFILLCGCSLALLPACNHKNKDFNLRGNTNADLRAALTEASRGDSFRKEGRFAPAAEAYKKSIEHKSDIGAVWLNYGVCLMEINDNLPAKSAFLRAVDLLPSDPRPYENLGTLYDSMGYSEDALNYYKFSLERDPMWLPSLRGAIVSYRKLRQSSELGLKYIDNGVLLEKDPTFLRMFQTERFRMTEALKSHKPSDAAPADSVHGHHSASPADPASTTPADLAPADLAPAPEGTQHPHLN